MKCIAVTGVKGGVGKSTFAILFANGLVEEGKKVVVVDLDVECPNDHLLLNVRLENGKNIYGEKPKLIKRKCKKCGICAKICKENAIFWTEGNYPIFFWDICSGCGACWHACPFNAIKSVKVKIGKYYINRIENNYWLVTGEVKEGVTETADIVKKTKEVGIKLAKRIKADYLLIDTAPGTHCNVIHSLLGCNKAFVVTEPTLLGKHDLEIGLKLLKKLKIKSEIVLNKAGFGDESLIEKVAKKYKVKIAYRIPYSEKILKHYARKDMRGLKL